MSAGSSPPCCPPPETISGWFERTAERFPERVALTGGGESWTYAQLNAYANRLAHLLRAHGVTLETPVALCLERSPELVAALLGILKAGGAYVPLDLSYPPERVAHMLADAEAPILLTQRALADRLPAAGATPTKTLCLDDPALALADFSSANLAPQAGPANLAYILYTSGSTGRPKGCCVTHHNVTRLFTATAAWFGFHERDVWTLFHSAAFDFSVWEIWGALFYGGRLVVVPYLTSRAPATFLQLLAAEGVTVLNQTPSAFRQLLAAEAAAAPAPALALRYVIFGGEALELRSLEPWFARHGDEHPRLVNMYGITETTVHVTYRPLTARDVGRGSVIGVPIPDLELRLLDAALRPCPPGEPGEIFVGGAGVARGYLRRPELTAERFVASPFTPGQCLYRSGDLAVRLPDGELQYLGRLDQQVKLRGFRVELGEIESALLTHPAIREATVLARGAGEAQELAAWLVLRGPEPTVRELRAHLARGLPEYMVPAAFRVLPSLPLTVNGKVDRAALLAGAGVPLRDAEEYEAPIGPLETALAALWQTVLGRARVGRQDDFFALGGHSLQAMQVAARAARLCGTTVPVPLLFEQPTLVRFAAALAALARPAAPGPSTGGPSARRYALAPMQQGMLFNALRAPGSGVEVEQMTWLMPATVDRSAFVAAWRKLAQRHALLRTAFVWETVDEPLQAVAPEPVVPLEELDWSALDDDGLACRWREFLAADRQRGIDLRIAPLWRLTLVRWNAAEVRFLLTMHHAITDGQSIVMILRELAATYAALRAGEAPELATPPAYETFIQWLAAQDWGRAEVHWRERFAGFRPVLVASAVAGPTPASGQPFRAQRETRLTPELTAALRRCAQAQRVTTGTLLQAVWGLLLGGLSGAAEVAFGVTRAGRRCGPLRAAEVMGPMINTVPVRAALPADGRLADLLQALARQQLEVRAFEHTPLVRIQEWCAGGRALFDTFVMFNRFDWPSEISRAAAGLGVREAALHEAPGYPLALMAYDGPALCLQIHFDPRQFDGAVVARMGRHLADLLAAVVERPTATLGELPAWSAATPAPAPGWPLSAEQRRLWFLDRTIAWPAAYNVPWVQRLTGPLDLARLERALRVVVDRQASLRTQFVERDGEAVQQVVALPGPLLQTQDLRAVPAGEREAAAHAEVARQLAQPLNLNCAPIWRLTCLALADAELWLVFTAHHILCDEWSLRLLAEELTAAYVADGAAAALLALPWRYGDYAVWQAAWLAEPAQAKARAYWREQLTGLAGALELPGDYPRPPRPTLRGGMVTQTVPRELAERLDQLGQTCGATRFMVLLAAWQVFLARLANQTEVVVAAPLAQRRQPEVEPLIGFFLNTVPLRTRLSRDGSFRELLGQVRRTVLESFAHGGLPFDEIVRLADAPRGDGGTPLAQVMLVLNQDPTPTLALPGVSAVPVELDWQVAKFDLTLFVSPAAAGGWQAALEYSRDLFAPATAARLLAGFAEMLAGVAAAPDTPWERLPWLPTDEREKVLRAFSATATTWPPPLTLPEWLAAQAHSTPAAVAVVAEAGTLTFRELDDRANQLARRLRGLGVGPGARVGIGLERSLEMLVGIVGVLKAGAAYVPLDPGYPPARLAFMLADAGIAVLLTQARLAAVWSAAGAPASGPAGEGFPPPSPETEPEASGRPRSLRAGPEAGAPTEAGRLRMLCLDADWPVIARASTTALPVAVDGDALAYVIYTSGSTGQPKGAMISHRAIVNHMRWLQDRFPVTAADAVLQKTPISFDASVWEIFQPLLTGARLVLARPDGHRDPGHLVDLIQRERVTVVQFVPALLALFIEHPRVSGCGSLRRVFSGGEALGLDLQRRVWARLTVELVNLYGPTETAIDASYWVCERDDARPVAPIGRPVANTQLYVLDARQQPVPVGVPGELFIGGAQVGLGYWNRPELTAASFLPDPFSATPGARMYRTGDRCRWLPDGNVEFLGRLDAQVKLRGLRVELGEIEAALGELPPVRHAAVAVREAVGTGPELVAYLVAAEGGLPPLTELREALRGRLPEHMVPGEYVVVAALPLTPNGKVDRRALPGLDGERLRGERGHQAPATPTEREVVAIWEAVLRREGLGTEAHFFEQGGHSLLAMQAAARLAQALGVEVPVRWLFEHPTVRELAARIESVQPGSRASGIVPVPRDGPHPLSHEQARLWFLHQLLPAPEAYNVVLALRLRGPLDATQLAAAWQRVVERHEMLRTRFGEVAGSGHQLVLPDWQAVVEREDWTALPSAERLAREAVALREAAAEVFDLTAAPPQRLRLLRCAPDEHLLVLTLHHLLCDEWSTRLLFEELASHYHGGAAPVPLAVQYADYAAWQRARGAAGAWQAHLDFWREQLAGAPAELELPADRPRPAQPSARGGQVRFRISPTVAAQLEALRRAEGCTPFMAWWAVFQALLHRLTGQVDFLVGTPVAQRSEPAVQGLIGFFLNTVPLRAQVEPAVSFRDWLRSTRARTLAAFAHGELPFDEIARVAGHGAGTAGLVSVFFVLQDGEAAAALRLPGVTVEPVAVENGTAKFDLSLFLNDLPAGGCEGMFEFSADLFDAATVARMAGQFEQLAAALTASPDAGVGDAEWLPDEQRRQVVTEFNRPGDAGAAVGGIHAVFETQAGQTPDAVAVRFGETQLSYAALEQQANALAAELRRRGVGPGVPVGISLERSPRQIVAVLATLKAGGACLPLDPDYPAERLRFMLEDAQPAVLLSQTSVQERLPETACPRLDLDAWPLAGAPVASLPSVTQPEHPAYVLFTSGSTGRPKGVTMPHRALLNLVAWQRRESACSAGAATLQFASLNFDVSFQEIFATLGTGGTLVMVPEAVRRDLPALAAVLREQRVARVFVPFVVLDELARVLSELDDPALALREVITAGEQLRITPAIREFFARHPGATLVNQYGPTETHVVTAHTLTGPAADWPALPVIGRPVANTQVYVLDERLRPVPVGVPGELCAGGAQVADGYWHRAELTAERFVPDPFSAVPGARLYRTGDRCRWLPDGTLEFLGRRDEQVKVRGFRVELGEIEAVLTQQPGVRQAAVVGRESAGVVAGLVAFLVMQPGATLAEGAVREALRKCLPDFMVPASFLVVEKLPWSPNGKVDRRALARRLAAEALPAGRAGVAPRTATEVSLAAVWEEVLGRRPVGVTDDFFDLGGHSLLAMRLVRAVEERFQRRLPLASLFAAPTVERLAELLEATTETAVGMGGGSFRGRGAGTPLFHIPGIAGFEFLPTVVAERVGRDRRFYDGLELAGLDGLVAPLTRVEDMAAHLLAQIRRVWPAGPYCLSGYSFGGVLAYEIARQMHASGRPVEALLLWDSFTPDAFSKRTTLETLRVLGGHLGQLGHRERLRFLGRQALKKARFLKSRIRRATRTVSAEASASVPTAADPKARVMAAAMEAYRTYRPGPWAGRVVVFQVEERESSLGFRYAPDPFNGWQSLAQGGVELVPVPGRHSTLLQEPAVSVLAERLAERLRVGGRA